MEKRTRNVVYKAEYRVDSSLRNILLAYHEDNQQKACRSCYEELLNVEEQVYFLNKEVMLIDVNTHESNSGELATTPSSQEKYTIEESILSGWRMTSTPYLIALFPIQTS